MFGLRLGFAAGLMFGLRLEFTVRLLFGLRLGLVRAFKFQGM